MSSSPKLTRRTFGKLGVAALTGFAWSSRGLYAEVPPTDAVGPVRLLVDVTRVAEGTHLRLTLVNTTDQPLVYDHATLMPRIERIGPGEEEERVISNPVDGFNEINMLVRSTPTEFRPLPPGVPVYVSTWAIPMTEGVFDVSFMLALGPDGVATAATRVVLS